MRKVNLDEIDHQILDILIDNSRIPFTDISKRLLISAGTVHVRVKKMEEAGIIRGSSLNLDYVKLEYATNATATLGITGNYIGLGRQVDTTAELSGRQRLYDNNYYQIFSYLIKSGVSVDRYSLTKI